MNLFQNRPPKLFLWPGCLLVGWLLAGCSHLYYADPNPAHPFVFPDQPHTAAVQTPVSLPSPTVSTPLSPNPVPTPQAPLAILPVSPAAGGSASDTLRIGDSVTVSFSDIPAPGLLPVTQRIREDGKITLPYNVTLVAAGKTVGQLQDEIHNAYVPKIFRQMTPSVTSEQRVFFVEGEVKTPSRLNYQGEMTVLRAITSAGGFTDFANRRTIELHRATGEKLIVNWYKAIDNPKLDLAVYPNDQVIVRKKII